MKTRLLLILTALQLCGLVYAQQDIDPIRFFPSQVGNVWSYYYPVTNSYSSIVLTRDSLLEDNSRLLLYDSPYLQYKIDTNYYVHWLLVTKFWDLYKLDADSGEVWMVEKGRDSLAPNFMAMVTNQYEAYLPYLNIYTLVKEITYYDVPAGDSTITENAWSRRIDLLGLDVGLLQVYNIEHGPEETLIGCVINGDTLGAIISIRDDLKLPDMSYQLSQNYPNPFNPATKIDYYLPSSGNIRLTIYNMLGEEISVLEEGYKAQGYHTANFNGNNLPSGIYIYRLNTGTINLTRKMILLK